MGKVILFISILILTTTVIIYGLKSDGFGRPILRPAPETPWLNTTPTPSPHETLFPIPSPIALPNSYIIPPRTHVFQTFNNCGPAGLSMQLSYFNIHVSQQELGRTLRPYQNPVGDNDDKSVTLEELAKEATKYNLKAFHRPGGSIELLKKFIAADLPVVVRTWTKPNEDIGHYRLVRGYDNQTQEIIQDDSLQGNNLRFGYADFMMMWQPFNYEYLVLVQPERKDVVHAILGENTQVQTAWNHAKSLLDNQLLQDPNNHSALFNMSIAEFHLGNYQSSIEYFERVEEQLPFRTLWYQIEPILAYQKIGNYQRVFAITNYILDNGNRAFSELYIIRGEVYQGQGNTEAARQEFQKALFYNENSPVARRALDSLE